MKTSSGFALSHQLSDEVGTDLGVGILEPALELLEGQLALQRK